MKDEWYWGESSEGSNKPIVIRGNIKNKINLGLFKNAKKLRVVSSKEIVYCTELEYQKILEDHKD